jgi:ethanolamine utilization microcompartment shell protein EutL
VEFRAKVMANVDVVNFAVDGSDATTDDDANCTGTFDAPTAPAGQVCIYLIGTAGAENLEGSSAAVSAIPSTYAFVIRWNEAADVGDLYVWRRGHTPPDRHRCRQPLT